MIIKSVKKKKRLRFNLFLKFYFYSSALALIILSVLFFSSGYWKQVKDPFLNRFYTSGTNNYLNIIEIGYKAFLGNFYNSNKININISFNNILKLENDRNQALNKDELAGGSSYDFSKVPVKISNKNFNLDADLRLKGDRNIHFNKDIYSSYKIDLKGSNTLFGLKKFSLMKPRARNYIHEWLFHELLGEGGLIKLKYDFLNLSINGQDNGLYVLEEGFDKILLERNKRRNGPIFSLHEEFSTEISKGKLEVYNKRYWLSEKNIKITKVASNKIKFFFEDPYNLETVLDVDKWAWFFAVADLNNYFHGLAAKSVKFYYNPISGKIEPIGFDGHRSIPNYNKNFTNWKSLINKYGPSSFDIAKKCNKIDFDNKCNLFVKNFFFFKNGELNIEFYKKYRNAVLKISSENFLSSFFNKRQKEIDRINSKIYSDYFLVDHLFFFGPGLYYFQKEDFFKKSKILQNNFNSEPKKVFGVQEKNTLLIYNNSLNNDFKMTKINCIDKNKNHKIFETSEVIKNNLKEPNVINLKNFSKQKLSCESFILEDSISKIKTYKEIDKINVLALNKLIKNNSNIYKKYFQTFNDNLILINDETIIDQNIFIPNNYEVLIYPGQKITLINDAFIFSNSPWIADGNEETIIISGMKNNFGGGLIIRGENKYSEFINVKFSYLSGLKKYFYDDDAGLYIFTKTKYDGYIKNSFKEEIYEFDNRSQKKNFHYEILGAINFFESKLLIDNAVFEKTSAEDALNIINSNFKISRLEFNEIASDAVDVDFGVGLINNAKFSIIGNDAIDLSGSNVTIKNINVDNVGDKIISVGENSLVNINHLRGFNSYIGLASKDGSVLKIKDLYLENVILGLTAYQKKKNTKDQKYMLKI